MEQCSAPLERLGSDHARGPGWVAKEEIVMHNITLHVPSPRAGTRPGNELQTRGVRRRLVLLAAACILWLGSGTAGAQALKNGTVSGTLVSASADIGGTVLTVPSDKAFVLTQTCSEDLRSFQLTAGSLIVPTTINAVSCAEYAPGIVFPGGSALTCSPTGNFGFGKHCLVTGVLTVAK